MQQGLAVGHVGKEGLHGSGLRTIHLHMSLGRQIWIGPIHPTVQAQIFRTTSAFFQTGNAGRIIDGIFGHLPIGRPLAAHDRDQPRLRDQHGMLTRDGLRTAGLGVGFHQWPQPGEATQNILALGIMVEVARGIA